MAGRTDPGLWGWRWPYTPTTGRGLSRFDGLEPEEALALAWSEPGRNKAWHRLTQQVVRDCMPLLARALDRLVESRSEK